MVNASKSLARDKIELDTHYKKVHISTTNAVVFEIWLSLAVILSIVVLYFVEKYSTVLVRDNMKGNPYKLIYDVIKFTCKNRRPIRRSAFTYCEDERPSKIDYGKIKYGGPFLTEQVEDVKVFKNIIIILILSSPYFVLELSGRVLLYWYHDPQWSTKISERFLFDYDGMSPLVITLGITLFLGATKLCFYKYLPSIFKRIGISLFIQCVLFLLCIVCGVITKGHHSPTLVDSCLGFNNNSHIHPWKLLKISEIFLLSIQQLLSSLSHMLFYIAVWQFICCQSLQNMKGCLFGLLWFFKAVFELLSLCLLNLSIRSWRLFKFGCVFDYCIVAFIIGFVSLIILTVCARKYKYRVRDDICNIYQFAEDYYSSIP